MLKDFLRLLTFSLILGTATFANAEFQDVRIVAANLTSGNHQSYDPGHGGRILKGLKPDIILIQEFNSKDIDAFVDDVCGTDFEWTIEPHSGGIPNGIISRWPIVESGEWKDPHISNRDFSWARIDIPGPVDLWAVSVHFKAGGEKTRRKKQAATLLQHLDAIPDGDYLVVGGDFNTTNMREPCIQILNREVSSKHRPSDKNGRIGTNASRKKPYDLVLPDDDLEAFHVPVVFGSLPSYPNGLVFDTRVFPKLALVAPAQKGDSGAPFMQHMAVVKDFRVPTGN